MSLMPRVRARVSPWCDDDDDDCGPCPQPGWLSHPLVIAAVTVCFQAAGELFVRKYSDKGTASAPADAELEIDDEPSPPKRGRKR